MNDMVQEENEGREGERETGREPRRIMEEGKIRWSRTCRIAGEAVLELGKRA